MRLSRSRNIEHFTWQIRLELLRREEWLSLVGQHHISIIIQELEALNNQRLYRALLAKTGSS